MTSWQCSPSTRLSSVTTNDLFLYEVLKLFHRWPLTFRTVFLSRFLPSLSLLFCRTEEYSISNKDMIRNQAVISAFKSDAVWIQQLKDPSLPRYLFGLYKAYMKRNTRGAAKNDTSFSNLYCLSIEIFIHSFNSVAIFGVLMLATCGRFSWSLSRYEISLETRKRIATFLS